MIFSFFFYFIIIIIINIMIIIYFFCSSSVQGAAPALPSIKPSINPEQLIAYQAAFGWGAEDVAINIADMARTGEFNEIHKDIDFRVTEETQ